MWQYDPANTSELTTLDLPTGRITVQDANPMTKATARAYVPTAFGTHILDPGDWVLWHESGYVFTLPDAAIYAVTTLSDDGSAPATPIFASEAFASDSEHVLSVLIDTHGLDWVLHVDPSNEAGRTYRLEVSATGAELGRWNMGDAVTIFIDGTVEVQVP